MLKVISFDVDGTLVDSAFADLVWLEGIPQLYAKKYHTDFETARNNVIEEYERIGEEDMRWYEIDYWFRRFGFRESHRDLLNRYKDSIVVYEEVPEVLEQLGRTYTLIVASNAHRDFLSLTLSSIKSYFDHIFSATSDFQQVRKHRNFYREIVEHLQVDPEEVAHVGDHPRFDHEIPLSVGIHAFLLDRTGEKGIRDLKEFEKRLMELESQGI